MSKYLFAWLCFLSITSCYNPSKQKIIEILRTFKESVIVIPDDLLLKAYNNEPPDFSLLTKTYKMVVYINTNGCESCKLNSLFSLSNLINEFQVFEKFGVLVLLHPSQYFETDHFIEKIRFRYTVFYDLNGSFEHLNPQLPKNEQFHTFLLDENNKIVLVGNPINNTRLKKLYLSVLNNVGAR